MASRLCTKESFDFNNTQRNAAMHIFLSDTASIALSGLQILDLNESQTLKITHVEEASYYVVYIEIQITFSSFPSVFISEVARGTKLQPLTLPTSGT